MKPKRGYDADFENVRLVLPNDQAEIGYLAGLIDGEGTIGYGANGQGGRWKMCEVVVFNNNRGLMDWLSSIGGTLGKRERQHQHHRRCIHYEWKVRRQADVIALLEAVMPYLKIKRGRAEAMLGMLKPKFEAVVGGPQQLGQAAGQF